jgi:hypothetical protein
MLLTNRPKLDIGQFFINGAPLAPVSEIKDLGVIFSANLNFSNHINSIISRAKQRLFLIRKCFVSSDWTTLIIAFKTYILPILEYCSQVWSPQNVTDIARIESVQRSFTKKLRGFENLSYAGRLAKAGLQTLEYRRLLADLSLTYKILHGLTIVGLDFQLSTSGNTRGHSWKLCTPKARLNTRLHFFSVRVVKAWNALSEDTVSADSLNSFRGKLLHEDLSSFLQTR